VNFTGKKVIESDPGVYLAMRERDDNWLTYASGLRGAPVPSSFHARLACPARSSTAPLGIRAAWG